MKRTMQCAAMFLALGAGLYLCGAATEKPNPVKRVGMVVGIKPERIAGDKGLHAGDNCSVRDLLSKYHIHNFSIFLREIDGKWYEFGYYEYTGDDFEGDMAKLAVE